MKTFENHPLPILKMFCEQNPEIDCLEFGLYNYVPQTVYDARSIITVGGKDLTNFYTSFLGDLNENEEISLQSRVYLKGKPHLHLPMIDFLGKITLSQINKVLSHVEDLGCKDVYFFNSGNSSHFYSMNLLTPHEWVNFMGRLLLLNTVDEPDIVDVRWVGHRLMAGYSALRWSHNTPRHAQAPELTHRAMLGGDGWVIFNC